MVVFKFDKNVDISKWSIVNDVVMGGYSKATMDLNDQGNGVFSGEVSLENNGGFSSVRYQMKTQLISDYNTFVLKVKGDGKRYQFRVKTKSQDWYSYIYNFDTSGLWEEIRINMSDLQPQFRGRSLNMAAFPDDMIEEIGLLIGNKKAESFHLEIDEIALEK